VAATVLYNLTCDELGLSTNAFETPTHVYTIFSNIAERVMVENTTSMGFNILKNLKSYSKYLQQYYPQQQALQIGLDKLYFYENSKGREINNTELLGLICYNLALFHSENKVYEKAYQYVELAQSFNQDSRSNATFEQHLYYKWGKQLYDQKKFYQAFEVIADAYYRYPENSDFKNNCLVMFIKALDNLYLIKDWEKSENIISEMDELNIRTRREVIHQKKILTDWANYFYLNQRKKQAERATELFHDTK
jgi:tetratricopeptide (TPR) repeat protein